MRLGWLQAEAFRSYRNLLFEPDAGVNLLVGANGVGKTNLLEAIDYATSLRSMRGAGDEDMIRAGHTEAVVRTAFETAGRDVLVEAALRSQGRNEVLFNGKRLTRRADLTGAVAAVTFLPDDLDVVKRGPGRRRDFIDDLAARLHPPAGAELVEMNRALRQRNALLRREGLRADGATLQAWEERLAVAGAAVVGRRRKVLHDLGPLLARAYGALAGNGDDVVWAYRAPWLEGYDDDPVSGLVKALRAARRRDMERRLTTVGPQRDEPAFTIGGRDSRTRASQGEQRALALALRVGSHELLARSIGSSPLLLLDDVFSELDPGRAARVAELLPQGQVFVTSAREDEIPLEGRVWHVDEQGIQ